MMTHGSRHRLLSVAVALVTGSLGVACYSAPAQEGSAYTHPNDVASDNPAVAPGNVPGLDSNTPAGGLSDGNTKAPPVQTLVFVASPGWSTTLVGSAWANSDANLRVIADMDGDKRADIIAMRSSKLFVANSKSTAFAAPVTLTDDYPATEGWTSQNATPRLFGDIDGDGRADIVGIGLSQFFVNLSAGTDYVGDDTCVTTDFTKDAGYVLQSTSPRFLADVNGDGKADMVGIDSKGVHVGLSTGATFAASTLWSSNFTVAQGWPSQDATPRMMADVDGDGKADVIGFGSAGVLVGFSNGKAFTTSTVSSEFTGATWTSNDSSPRFVADVNGDGKADFVGIDAAGVHVALSTGTTQASPSAIACTGLSTADGFTGQSVTPRFLVDLNGDQKADLVAFGTTQIRVFLAP